MPQDETQEKLKFYSAETIILARKYVDLLGIPQKTAAILGEIQRILLEAGIPDLDLQELGRDHPLAA